MPLKSDGKSLRIGVHRFANVHIASDYFDIVFFISCYFDIESVYKRVITATLALHVSLESITIIHQGIHKNL